MLSISGAMTAGDGLTAYFTGAEDYYLSSPGQWQGKGATDLGLSGVVTKEQFKLVASGHHPGTGRQLVAGQKDRKQAGNDLTFSAPKSVSIAAAFDNNILKFHEKAVERVVDYIESNHICARHQVDGQRDIEQTGKLVAGKFTHATSRELDPQLHTHVFAFNLTQRSDGEWRALHNRQIFQNKMALGKLYRNELANALTKAGYGVEITDRKEGFFRLKNVPEQLEEHFSTRRAQIESKVKNPEFRAKYPDANKATLYQIAALGTRARKKKISPSKIKKHWQKDIEEQGFSINTLSKISSTPIIKPQNVLNPAKAIDKAATALTETDSILAKTKTLAVAANLSFGQHSLSELDNTFQQSSIVKVGRQSGRDMYTTPMYTTPEMLKIEQSVLNQAKAGMGQRQPIASSKDVASAIKKIEQKNGWQFTSGQKQAINVLATAEDKVLLIQGDAGTGKTASLAAFSHLAKDKGYTVKGLGFTGKAADQLQKGAGFQSETIDSFLLSSLQGHKNKEVWLVDESSMAGARHYSGILDRAKKAGVTVAFIGDKKQFGSISAGNMFTDLQGKIGVHAQLTQTMRQKTEETRAMVNALNRGKNEQAFSLLEKKGNLKEYKSQNDLRRAAVQHYIRQAKSGKNAVVITQSNDDKQRLNKQIKSELIRSGITPKGQNHDVLVPANIAATDAPLSSTYQSGQTVQFTKAIGKIKAGSQVKISGINPDQNTLTVQTGKKQYTIDVGKYHKHLAIYNSQSVNLSPKDKIVFLKNDKELGVKNGQTGEIKSIDKHGNVEVKTGKKTVSFSLSSSNKSRQHTYPYIEHGMAMTAHKTQGATVDHVIWHAPAKAGKDRQINRETTYVAATRAKESFTVLTDDKKQLQNATQKNAKKDSVLSVLDRLKKQAISKKSKEQEKEQKSRTHKPKVEKWSLSVGQ